jgi:2'-5' RNA ligase
MIRAFVGLPLPPPYQELLQGLRKTLAPRLRSKVAWTRAGNWHLTLKFLGDVEPGRVEPIGAALAAVRFAPYALKAGAGGFFPPWPGRKPPRVAWAGLEKGAEETVALARAVERALEPLGFAPEARPFSPHLTLCRVKRPARGEQWDEMLREVGRVKWPECVVDRFVLWQSVLGPQGPAYTPLREVPAAG